jgi:hypothetical protein
MDSYLKRQQDGGSRPAPQAPVTFSGAASVCGWNGGAVRRSLVQGKLISAFASVAVGTLEFVNSEVEVEMIPSLLKRHMNCTGIP